MALGTQLQTEAVTSCSSSFTSEHSYTQKHPFQGKGGRLNRFLQAGLWWLNIRLNTGPLPMHKYYLANLSFNTAIEASLNKIALS